MARPAFWKGYLKLSLVTCPVAMVPVRSESARIRFRTLNRATGNPVQSRYVDAETGRPVKEDDEAKGYTSADRLVIIEDEELEAVALESTRTIDIEAFVPRQSIGWLWYDTPHYLRPDDKVGEEAFAVIREAMASTGTIGISRLVLYRRERAVLLEPRGSGIVVWTLRYGDEVRDPADSFGPISSRKPDAKTLALFQDMVESRTRHWDASMVDDPVEQRLEELIAAKQKGQRRPKKPVQRDEAEQPSNVVNLMDALRKSLGKPSRRR